MARTPPRFGPIAASRTTFARPFLLTDTCMESPAPSTAAAALRVARCLDFATGTQKMGDSPASPSAAWSSRTTNSSCWPTVANSSWATFHPLASRRFPGRRLSAQVAGPRRRWPTARHLLPQQQGRNGVPGCEGELSHESGPRKSKSRRAGFWIQLFGHEHLSSGSVRSEIVVDRKNV